MLVVACDRCRSLENISRLEDEDVCAKCLEGDYFTFMATYSPTPEEEWGELMDDRRALYDELCGGE